MNEIYRKLDGATRRAFVSAAAKACLGVSVFPAFGAGLASAAPAGKKGSAKKAAGKKASGSKVKGGGKAKNVIYLFMEGAMSHLDTFDVKENASDGGQTKPIKTKASGVKFAEYFENLAKLADKVAVVNSLHTVTGAHDPGRYLMRTSYEQIATIRHPSMGPWAQTLLGKRNKSLPDSVVIGGGSRHPAAGFMETRFSPLPIGSAAEGLQNRTPPAYLAVKDFKKRLELIDSFDTKFRKKYDQKQVRAYTDFYNDTVDLLQSDELEAFDIKKEDEKVREAYGNDRFGQGVLLARRLIEANVRFVEVVSGGWDDHNEIYEDDHLPSRARNLDRTLSTLITDLAKKGLLGETLIVLTTEFGRTPKISQRAGRDHHPAAFSGLFAGGGIKGGQVYGKTDAKGASVDDEGVMPADFNATIAQAMGLPLDKEVFSKTGRPFKVAHDGEPIAAFF